MGQHDALQTAREAAASESFVEPASFAAKEKACARTPGISAGGHLLFQIVWHVENVLLVLSALLVLYAAFWEYSTRRYLNGFSDAIIPAASSDLVKTEAILNWMANGPKRRSDNLFPQAPERDPVDTLNYAELLRMCGSATNAFINLADSKSLKARRLLLLNSQGTTKHVVAEVMLDGRWIVVDPTFRTILRGVDGHPLTQRELADPGVFAAATREIRGYDPAYTFDNTAHVRLSRWPFLGRFLRPALDWLLPGWKDWTITSLFAERASLATLVLALALVLVLALLRQALSWWAENRLGIRRSRIRGQLRRACHAFLETPS
jgi:hypothetical protein